MKPTTAWTVSLLLLTATSSAAHSQTSRSDPTDFQSWYSAELHFDLPSRWASSLKYKLRLVDNSAAYRGSYLYAEVGRGVLRHMKLFGNYRLALVDRGTYHRFALGSEGSLELAPVTLSLRPMVQYQRQNFAGNDEQSSDEDTFLRTRLEAEYEVSKRLALYASTEPFVKLGGDHGVDNLRNELGVKYEYRKGARIGLYYLYRPDFAKSYQRTYHVVGLDLDFTVKIPGRKQASVSTPAALEQ